MPLEECHEETVTEHGEDEDELITRESYISKTLGFVVGIWGVLGIYCSTSVGDSSTFEFLDAVYNWLYVKVALNKAKLERILKT